MNKEGAEPTWSESKSLQRIDHRDQASQSLFQEVEAKTIKEGERRTLMEGTVTRCIRWEVDPVKMGTVPMEGRSSKFIPLHPPFHSCKVGIPTVREHDYFGFHL